MKRLNFLLCLVCTLLISSAARAATVRTVALSGQQAPGTLGDVSYSSLSSPALNDSGGTAFLGSVTGSGVDETNNQGIWSEGSGSLALVIRTGNPAPGAPSGVNFSGLGSPLLNDAGQTAFFGFDTRQGLWSEGSGSLALVARAGDPAPGTFGVINPIVFKEFDSLVLNNAGRTAFSAALTGISGPLSIGLDDKANWTDRSGTVQLFVRGGNQAPGAPAGVRFVYTRDLFGYGEEFKPGLNNIGQIAFLTKLTGTGVNSSNNRGIWSEGSGSLAMVARSGNQAPGTPSGVNYSSFGGFAFAPPALNDAGKTAFYASLAGSGVDSSNNGGIWSEGSGSLALVARTGSPAPGTPSGVNFSSLAWLVVLNNAGQTAFGAQLTGSGIDVTNSGGIWSEGAGTLALVARAGDQAPGTLSGVNFSSFGGPALNDSGQTAFYAYLTGSNVDETNNQGIWATNPTGALQLIARTGDPLEVAPGDFRAISGLSFIAETGNSDGRPSGFSNLGQLAFSATFTDGSSGIFVSNRIAVPEPSTLLLLCFGILAVLWRRRDLVCASILAAVVCAANSAQAVTIDMVTVGNAGNPPDQNYGGQSQFGAVPHGYRIAIHEVTNGEYATFLSEKVSIYYDPFDFGSLTFGNSRALLNESMLYNSRGGLSVVTLPLPCGDSGIYCTPEPPPPPHFEARVNMDNKPVNFVSWYDAIRYVNWLNNGQSYGGTESGAYTLGTLGASGIPLDPNAIARNPGATWVLPNENEWYKAAYYQPANNGGDSDGYWLSPTRSNVTSAVFATAGSTGNISNPGANVMNESGATWNGQTGNVTSVGSAGTLSASYYGTFDQGGNVREWIESAAPGGRIVRGGSWDGTDNLGFRADQRTILLASYEDADLGFRVAQLVPIVPEPSTVALAAAGVLGFVLSQRRSCRNGNRLTIVVLIALCAASQHAQALTIDMVTVGNPGNAPRPTRWPELGTDIWGSVANTYQIGKYEVTAGQYTEFLNAVAKADPNGLYNTAMGDPIGARGANIQRTGLSPDYRYSVAADWADRPVNWVSFWDAARFANWLHNGQPTGAQGPGTTEGGAYHDVGDQTLFGRNAGAKFFIPSENEWYKAAYHDKSAGLAASYSLYPTGYPTGGYPFPGNDFTESTNPGYNANCYDGNFFAYAIGSPYYRTVGGEFELSDSFYGTFDQGGNVAEWLETLFGASRGIRGGSFLQQSPAMSEDTRMFLDPSGADAVWVGFRVASSIPEPSTLLLLCFGSLAVLWRRRGIVCSAAS